jgi:hypothetical protein
MYGEPMESWINVFDINAGGQNDKACQKIMTAINTRDTRCVEEGMCPNLSLKLVRSSGCSCLKTAGDAANTVVYYADACNIKRQA